MKKNVLLFISGFLTAGVLLQLTPGFAADLKKVVEANLNTANIVVNGQKVDADNLEYNDSLYLPIRKISEALGKDVSWNSETKTAEIKDKAPTPGVPSSEVKHDSFIFSSDTINIIDNNTGEISFKVVDQNGKEYEGKEIETKFVCIATYGSVKIDTENHKVIIKDETGQLKNQTSIQINFIDKTSGYLHNKTFTIPKAGK